MDSHLPFDIVILGATGLVGQYAMEELAISCSKDPANKLRWAGAGRSKLRIRNVLNTIQQETVVDLSSVPIIEIDVTNHDSLISVTQQTRVVVNCVGPYKLYAEPLIKACLQTKTHYVDVSGEQDFNELMQLKYSRAAEEAGVLIITGCGFHSLLPDLGVLMMQEKYQDVIHVDSFITFKPGPRGLIMNEGIWNSIVLGFGRQKEMMQIRKNLYESLFGMKVPSEERKPRPFIAEEEDMGVCIPYNDADHDVVNRTQAHNLKKSGVNPIELNSYVCVSSLKNAFGLMIIGMVIWILGNFSWGRSLLIKYPHVFSYSIVTKDKPSRKQLKETSFEIMLIGERQEKKTSASVVFAGPEAWYLATSKILVQAAVMLVRERDSIPFRGGVITPGLAFKDTSILKNLKKSGFTSQLY